jgi:hypothetical protein
LMGWNTLITTLSLWKVHLWLSFLELLWS